MMRTRMTGARIMVLCACLTALIMATRAFAAPGAGAAEAVPCDIQRGPCTLVIADGMSVVFDVLPRPVTAMTELTFVVTLTRNGLPVRDAAVTLDLSMPGMYMGRNRPVMNRIRDGRYEGKGVITRCMSGKKTWQADIALTSAAGSGSAAFVFEVK